jgi:hypothetical protein
MKFSRVRLLVLAVASASFALVWTISAAAHPLANKATVVKVTAAPGGNEFSFKLSTKKVKHGTVTFKLCRTTSRSARPTRAGPPTRAPVTARSRSAKASRRR